MLSGCTAVIQDDNSNICVAFSVPFVHTLICVPDRARVGVKSTRLGRHPGGPYGCVCAGAPWPYIAFASRADVSLLGQKTGDTLFGQKMS